MLTDLQCKTATCPLDKRHARFTDAGGLYLQVDKNGSKRWFWKYRTGGVEKRIALGGYPEVSLKDARLARDEARALKSTGQDPNDSGSTLDFSQDLEMSAVFSDLLSIRQTLETQTQLEAQLKQRIQQRMGDASKAVFETGNVTWRRSKDGTAFDMAKLLEDHPDYQQTYAIPKPGSRRFLVNG